MSRYILALILLLAPTSGARAQTAGVATPSSNAPSGPPPLVAPGALGGAAAEDVLPLLETLEHQGVLVETLDGQVVRAQSADKSFNPASAVKLATALDALDTFGPKHRFATTF